MSELYQLLLEIEVPRSLPRRYDDFVNSLRGDGELEEGNVVVSVKSSSGSMWNLQTETFLKLLYLAEYLVISKNTTMPFHIYKK